MTPPLLLNASVAASTTGRSNAAATRSRTCCGTLPLLLLPLLVCPRAALRARQVASGTSRKSCTCAAPPVVYV
jgi:hypothetical protein